MTDKLAFDVGLQEDAIGTGAGRRGCDGDTAGSELGCRRSAPQTFGTESLGVWMDIFWTERLG